VSQTATNLTEGNVEDVVALVGEAGEAILSIYESDDFGTRIKEDKSPLTEADMASHEVLIEGLRELTPNVPILSEESEDLAFEERRSWNRFWLVDPLDGTKEFIKQNGEFTVNVALIEDGKPVVGVVGVPASDTMYWGIDGIGAFKRLSSGETVKLRVTKPPEARKKTKVVVSRSHVNEATEEYASRVRDRVGDVELMPVGSALKLCMVAEGQAQVYPRLGPTMEWDIAAADCVVRQAGGIVRTMSKDELRYNKKELLNPFFVASCCEALMPESLGY
jgi:3'(2'), 5'-bisphosphate nucleotidase